MDTSLPIVPKRHISCDIKSKPLLVFCTEEQENTSRKGTLFLILKKEYNVEDSNCKYRDCRKEKGRCLRDGGSLVWVIGWLGRHRLRQEPSWRVPRLRRVELRRDRAVRCLQSVLPLPLG